MAYQSDFYAQKAKQEGYSARSVYKLQEIHSKHLKNLNKAKKILDLGAAPGSWTQYLQKHIHPDAEIIAIDLNPLSAQLKEKPQVTQLELDFTDAENIEKIISWGPFDFVLSDAAPLTTGNKSVDTARSELIVETIAYIAQQTLNPGGVMVAKLFQGGGASALIQEQRKNFKKVACLRPKAVKKSSFEMFLICS